MSEGQKTLSQLLLNALNKYLNFLILIILIFLIAFDAGYLAYALLIYLIVFHVVLLLYTISFERKPKVKMLYQYLILIATFLPYLILILIFI